MLIDVIIEFLVIT